MAGLALCWEQDCPTQPQALPEAAGHKPFSPSKEPAHIFTQVTLTAVLPAHLSLQLGAGDIAQERMRLSMSPLLM